MSASRLFFAIIQFAAIGGGGAQSPTARERPVVPLGLDAYVPLPPENEYAAAKVALGRRLFLDPILSADSSIACATCHIPARGFADGRRRSLGVHGRSGTRNVPALLNRAYGSAFFWDGRATTLEQQVLQPIEDVKEMGASLGTVMSRLKGSAEYRRIFESAFPDGVTGGNLARSLASYVRSIFAGNAALDRYNAGDSAAMSAVEVEGMRLFRGKARCTSCHIGPNLTDERFHNTGIAFRDGAWSDSGRFLVTGRLENLGAFKTPTLREIDRTAPYMHDGSLASLAEVIAFYDRGGNDNPMRDRELRPLRLNASERRALEAFLRTLTGTVAEGTPTRCTSVARALSLTACSARTGLRRELGL